jgi:hypothetical protein
MLGLRWNAQLFSSTPVEGSATAEFLLHPMQEKHVTA